MQKDSQQIKVTTQLDFEWSQIYNYQYWWVTIKHDIANWLETFVDDRYKISFSAVWIRNIHSLCIDDRKEVY